MNSERSAYSLAIAAGASIILIIATLTIQHFRHGWPFSLHHGQTTEVMAPPPATPAHRESHGRVTVDIGEEWVTRLGMQTSIVSRDTIAASIRAVATVVPDEERVVHIHTRVSGWIEELYVATTGESVRKGQPLAGLFSQELYASQIEYLSLFRQAGSQPTSAVQASARQRLQVLGMSEAEIRTIERQGNARRLVTITSPLSGVVLRRSVSRGTAVDPSTELMVVADLSQVWVVAELPERHAAVVRQGTSVTVDVPASGRAAFAASISFLHPTLDERTRSRRVRIPIDNQDRRMLPGMTGYITLESAPRDALIVPRDALVDTGEHQHVFVETAEGRFEPRVVQTGLRLSDKVEILEGLEEGERVVTSGVFLIDSESRLRGSGGGTGHAGHGGHGTERPPAPALAPGAPSHDDHGGAH
jgi:membrane fusion protein, copper/silver efflux system